MNDHESSYIDDIERRNNLDQNFKSIIHRASILAWILKSCIDDLKDKDIEEIKKCLDIGADGIWVNGKESESTSSDNGPIFLDNVFEVRLSDSEPITVIVGIEGQNESNPGYPIGKRAEYYVSRMISDQRGSVFKGSDYGSLRKTYSIWIMMDPLKGNRNSMVKYRMTPVRIIGSPEHVEELCTSNVVFINLGGEYTDIPDEVGFAATLFSSAITEEQRRGILKEKYKIPAGEYPSKELNEMGFIYEDTKSRFLREGRAEERIQTSVDAIVNLVNDEGLTIEKASAAFRLTKQEEEIIIPLVQEKLRETQAGS